MTMIHFAGQAPPQTHSSAPLTHRRGLQHLQRPPHPCPWLCRQWSGRMAPWTRPARPSTSSCSPSSKRCPKTSDRATPAPSPVLRDSKGESSMPGFWWKIILQYFENGPWPCMLSNGVQFRWENAWLRQNEARGHERLPAWTRLNPHFDNLVGWLLQIQISPIYFSTRTCQKFFFKITPVSGGITNNCVFNRNNFDNLLQLCSNKSVLLYSINGFIHSYALHTEMEASNLFEQFNIYKIPNTYFKVQKIAWEWLWIKISDFVVIWWTYPIIYKTQSAYGNDSGSTDLT